MVLLCSSAVDFDQVEEVWSRPSSEAGEAEVGEQVEEHVLGEGVGFFLREDLASSGRVR